MKLTTNHLNYQTKQQQILREVTLTVNSGTIYGLLGPNGAGKSTLMKLITGIMQPTSGTILFDGQPLTLTDLKKIGALIERPAIYENLTAAENLRVLSLLLDLPKENAVEALDLVELSTGNKLAKHFSLGMKQRLGIAMTLIKKPQLLILDEPTNGLDPVGIEALRNLLKKLAQSGMTIIISSHILAEIEVIADTIGILVEGRLLYEEKNQHHDLEATFMELIKGGAQHV